MPRKKTECGLPLELANDSNKDYARKHDSANHVLPEVFMCALGIQEKELIIRNDVQSALNGGSADFYLFGCPTFGMEVDVTGDPPWSDEPNHKKVQRKCLLLEV